MRPSPVLFGLFAAIACSSSTTAPHGTESIFVVPAMLAQLDDTSYYDLPWPNDLRKEADGTIRVTGMHNPNANVLVNDYIGSTKTVALKGFSPAGSGYFRFTGPIDPATLPMDPKSTLDAGASVQIIDIDPKSPEHGKRRLTQTYWRQAEGIYWLPNTLAVAPALGYPLRPSTRYATIVTRGVKALDGSMIAPSADLVSVLGMSATSARTQTARAAFASAVTEIEAAGVPRTELVHFTVFTTNDPTSELFAVADAVRSQVPAPTADAASWVQKEQRADYDVYEGSYGPSPNYQAGKLPFTKLGDGGNFAFDASGKPIVQGTFNLRFSLVVPNAAKCPLPAAGYPITLYAHGTGGDYRSVISEGGSVGAALASKCVASMGVDQIFHGARPGAPPPSDPNREGNIQLLFFNLNNPIAARTNGRQSAIDVVQQARLFTESHLKVPAANSRTTAEISFDDTKLIFFGHSQGGVNGPLFLAADKQARGGVLSGTGAMITIALLEKTKPQPSVAAAVKTVLGLFRPEDADELNLFHPMANMAQLLVDTTDTVHYLGYVIAHPRPGFPPKSIYQTEGIGADGIGDSYAPPHGIEVASTALGLPRQAPGVHPLIESAFSGLGDVTVPAGGLSGNLAGGLASGVLAQFPPVAGSDGHFVVFEVAQARAQAAGFCRNLADDPHGRVPAL
jgi:hypothetical protein